MHESELDGLVDCVECGATLSVSRDRAYSFGADHVLCFECAKRRGGAGTRRATPGLTRRRRPTCPIRPSSDAAPETEVVVCRDA